MPMNPSTEERRNHGRRGTDSLREWLPMIISISTTLLMLGVIYGKLAGRLDLIEYRLQQVEHHTGTNDGR